MNSTQKFGRCHLTLILQYSGYINVFVLGQLLCSHAWYNDNSWYIGCSSAIHDSLIAGNWGLVAMLIFFRFGQFLHNYAQYDDNSCWIGCSLAVHDSLVGVTWHYPLYQWRHQNLRYIFYLYYWCSLIVIFSL